MNDSFYEELVFVKFLMHDKFGKLKNNNIKLINFVSSIENNDKIIFFMKNFLIHFNQIHICYSCTLYNFTTDYSNEEIKKLNKELYERIMNKIYYGEEGLFHVY